MTAIEQPRLPEQQRILANSMLYRLGGKATLDYAIVGNARLSEYADFDETNFADLKARFADNPHVALASARESLMAIGTDTRLTEGQRSSRLDRYMDAYFDLTLMLDHEIYPDTQPGRPMGGMLNYIPDGFVDMGRSPSSREEIRVDKEDWLNKNREELKRIFSLEQDPDYGRLSPAEKEQHIAERLAWRVHNSIRYNRERAAGYKAHGAVDLQPLMFGVCRHQALAFQVLAQTVGLESRIMKCDVAYGSGEKGPHVANAVRIGHDWVLYDVTAPRKGYQNDQPYWKADIMRIPPPDYWRDKEVFDNGADGKRHRKYVLSNGNSWRVARHKQPSQPPRIHRPTHLPYNR